MKNINKELHLFLQKLPDLKNKSIAIGYSAGADSTLLLHLLNEKSKFFGFEINAVFFSHENSPMNQGEDKSLLLAKETCEKLNINFIHHKIMMEKEVRRGWEEIGRENRIDFYKKLNFDFVFLGHHKDDQNETTMIQLMRGAGKGMSGMKEIDGIFVRPFLNLTKDEIYTELKSKNIPWVEDPTNTNTDFTRNFWRKQVLPLIEKHYPQYRQNLDLFRKKLNTQNKLLRDLAIVDGLEELKRNNQLNIAKIDIDRKINLLNHFFSDNNSHIEQKKIENWLRQKDSIIESKKYRLHIENDTLVVSWLDYQNKKSNRKLL